MSVINTFIRDDPYLKDPVPERLDIEKESEITGLLGHVRKTVVKYLYSQNQVPQNLRITVCVVDVAKWQVWRKAAAALQRSLTKECLKVFNSNTWLCQGQGQPQPGLIVGGGGFSPEGESAWPQVLFLRKGKFEKITFCDGKMK